MKYENVEGVRVEKILDTAQKGWWIAYGPQGNPICSRRTKKEAFERGVEMARVFRMKVCGRIG